MNLQQAIEAREKAEIETRAAHDAVNAAQERLSELEAHRAASRVRLKFADSDHKIKTEERTYCDLNSQLELLLIRLEGLTETAAKLDAKLVEAQHQVDRATVDVCRAQASVLETRALQLAKELGPLIHRRRKLARLAATAATAASGGVHASDPLGGQYANELTPFHRELEELLAAKQTDTAITLQDLLI